MEKKNFIVFSILVLLFLCVFEAVGGEIKDEFTSPNLNNDLWVIKSVETASYQIKDGKLILSSPKNTDGIILYYNGEVKESGFSFEAMVDSSGIIDSGYVTTTKTMTMPEQSNVFNPLRLAQFRLKSQSWLVRNENIENVIEGNIKSGMYTYRIELGETTLKFYFDGKEVAEVPKVAESRFFCVSPDPYSSDYSGELVVEYIKFSAPWIISVDPKGKLASSWGDIKGR